MYGTYLTRDAWLNDEDALDAYYNGPRCPDCDEADLRGVLCECQKLEDPEPGEDEHGG